MEKIETTVKYVKHTGYYRQSYTWGTVADYVNVYKLEDEDGNLYVWKTTNGLVFEEKVPIENRDGYYSVVDHFIPVGSTIRIKGSVKGESEYRGEKQIEIQRVKVLEIVDRALTKEEKDELKKQEQLASLNDGDFVWTIPYKQYKEHYSDCETVAGSFMEAAGDYRHPIPASISVIIRDGRLKKSGVRGEHYSGYKMQNEEGKWITYRAVCEENALKRVQKDYPNHTWKCVKVYDYRENRERW